MDKKFSKMQSSQQLKLHKISIQVGLNHQKIGYFPFYNFASEKRIKTRIIVHDLLTKWGEFG